MQKFNTEPMLRPTTTTGLNVDVKPTVPSVRLVIDSEDVEIPKQSSPSPESTLTSTGIGKGLCGNFDGERHFANDEEEAAATCGGGNGGGGERKKLRLTEEQIMVLEQAFRGHSTVNTKQKLELARQVNLNPRQVEVWFQNRRARIKLKHTEAECEQLKKLRESLKEENRKLQKEVQELKNLQAISPDHESLSMSIIHANSHQVPNPTTLNLCHSCKSVFISTSSSLSKDMQKSQKLALDIFPRLRSDPSEHQEAINIIGSSYPSV
ncbi:hypothetical protein Cgig2_033271 [Carnegiea gigantea]|uniref:Homeobox domain-containing protein n=1 Tax=Carnegiea gigantea TaxID=171969 RepID=A0A9Q1KWW1_9CARY|nr:hypothetical protein Cgig2_033271 [Carnegiea gigantea]